MNFRSLSPSPPVSSSLIFQPQPQKELFKIRYQLKRLKSEGLNTSQVSPEPKKTTCESPRQKIKASRSQDSHLKKEVLASTFGSENFLNFRSKPLKRKKRKISPLKHPNPTLFPQEYDSEEQENVFLLRNNSVKRRQLKMVKKVYKINDFILLQLAGEGTYSQVYKAIQKQTGFICSLKILNKQKMAKMGVLDNLIRQIKISMFLSHPNLVALYGCFSDQKCVYLVSQLATDHNLFKAMNVGRSQGHKRMPCEVVSGYMSQICQALKYMHSHMILHRDVKPENILITYTITAKLCDFGWSVHSPDRALRNTFCGTPLYLAPQLIQQGNYDESVDVWAIGVVTFELLTGEIPFRIRSVRDLSKVVTQQINYEGIDHPLAVDFIGKALKKQKQHRQTMAQMCQHPFLLHLQSLSSL